LQLMREDYMDRDDVWENEEVTALRQTMLEMQKEVSQMRVEATMSGIGGSKSGKRGSKRQRSALGKLMKTR
jgi:hypothetical protein